jgi:hypothetical protein
MKESDKNVEKFIEKIMEEASLETPSFDFTSNIMAQVAVCEKAQIKEYKPLISKPIWFGIFTILTVIIGSGLFGDAQKTQFDFGINSFLKQLPTLHFSDTVTYSILIVTLMVLIQIPLLKNYFDKHFEV